MGGLEWAGARRRGGTAGGTKAAAMRHADARVRPTNASNGRPATRNNLTPASCAVPTCASSSRLTRATWDSSRMTHLRHAAEERCSGEAARHATAAEGKRTQPLASQRSPPASTPAPPGVRREAMRPGRPRQHHFGVQRRAACSLVWRAAVVFEEGVAVVVQQGRGLLGLPVGRQHFGALLG